VVSVHRIVGAAGNSSELVYTREVASRWMDASHREWFGRLFDDFRRSIREGNWVSAQTVDALMCIETIGAAYQSAALGSREVPIPDPRYAPAMDRPFAVGRVASGTRG